MSQTIKLKRSSVVGAVPTIAQLELGEISINTYDGKMYIKTDTGVNVKIFEIGKFIPERAGMLWRIGQDYKIGDTALVGEIIYVALQDHLSDYTYEPGRASAAAHWKVAESYSRTGAIHDPTLEYKEGDTVTVGDDIYIAPAGGVPITIPATIPPDAPWVIATANEERGGIAWVDGAFDGTGYLIGDIVTDNGILYMATSDNNNSPSGLIGWKAITFIRDYSPTDIYEEGDIITAPGGGDYIVPPGEGTLTTPAPVPPASPWVQVTANVERGGVFWNKDYFYIIGDVVTEDGIAYVAIDNNNALSPIANPTYWEVISPQELGGVIWKNASDYKIGDIVTEGTTGYVCNLPHTSLTGGIDGEPSVGDNWDMIQATAAEKGGLAHDITTTYDVGDMVTEGGIPYVCTTSPATNPGAFDPIEWTEIGGVEVGGREYDPLIQYEIGDVVSIGDELYIIGEDPSIPGDPMPISGDPSDPLDNTTPDPFITAAAAAEKGGIAWALGIDYLVGDIVSELNIIYTCNVDHTSLTGDDPLGSPSQLTQTSWVASAPTAGATAGDLLVWDDTAGLAGLWVAKTNVRFQAYGDGATQEFIPAPGLIFADVDVDVFVNGTLQELTTTYTIADNNLGDTPTAPETVVTFTLTSIPAVAAWIRVNTIA